MNELTYYQLLGIDKNATPEIIELAYKRRLKEAKDLLKDSPMFYNKEQKLQDAYRTLSDPETHELYNAKLAREAIVTQTQTQNRNIAISNDTSSTLDNVVDVVFSKAFLGFISLLIVILVFIPSGEDRVFKDVTNKHLDNNYDIQNQQIELERQKEERYSASQDYAEDFNTREQRRREAAELHELEMDERRLDMEIERDIALTERETRFLTLQEERDARDAKYRANREQEIGKQYDENRKLRREKEAVARSRRFVKSAERTTRLRDPLHWDKNKQYKQNRQTFSR